MPRAVQPRRTNRYPAEFKAKAVQLSLVKGVEVQEVAKTLDIHPFMLSRWRKEYRATFSLLTRPRSIGFPGASIDQLEARKWHESDTPKSRSSAS